MACNKLKGTDITYIYINNAENIELKANCISEIATNDCFLKALVKKVWLLLKPNISPLNSGNVTDPLVIYTTISCCSTKLVALTNVLS